jgi:hypothetical protein
MFQFSPWGRFKALRDRTVDERFMDAAAHESEDAFKIGLASSKSGIHHPGLPKRSSAPGEYPANQSGKLRASISSTSSAERMDIGSSVFYAKFLREGTRKMNRRRMSDDAIQEGVPKARSVLRGWVRWSR